MNKRQNVFAVALGMNVAAILWITLLSRTTKVIGDPYLKPFHSFVSAYKNIRRDGLSGNFLGNIAMFVPFGFFMPLADDWFQKWKTTILAGLSFSVVIEVLQFVTGRGYFQVDDMILNTLGTISGFVIYQLLKKTKVFKLDTQNN